MRACVRLDDGVCSGWFALEQGLQGCALAPSVQYPLRSGYQRGLYVFQGEQRHHGCFRAPQEKNGGRGGGATTGEPALTTSLWGLLYTDDAAVVSQSPEQLRKMMSVTYSSTRRLASPYRMPTLRPCVYARSGCRSPPPYSA